MAKKKGNVEVCRRLKEMIRDKSKSVKEYYELRKKLEKDAYAWTILDDIYQDEAHHHSQLVILTKRLCR